MTKEQENAINELQRMKMDKSHTGSEYNAIKTAIQAIEDLDKITKEILSTSKYYRENVNTDKADGMMIALQIIYKYRGAKKND